MAKFVQWYNADGLRWCSSCAAYMSPDLFHRGQPKTPDGLQRHCMLCRRTVRKAQYQAHRAREIAATALWQAAHPEQARAYQRTAQRGANVRKSLRTGALWRRLAREAQRTAALARVRRMLRETPDLTPVQVAAVTGWPYSTAYRRLLMVRREMRSDVADRAETTDRAEMETA